MENARHLRQSEGEQEAVSTVIIWNVPSWNIWGFWQWGQTKARHISQPNVGYFQDRKLERKSEWRRRRRRSQANETVWSFGTQGKGEEKRAKEVQKTSSGVWEVVWEERPRPLLCRVNALQLFHRKHGRWGSMRRPRAPAFRWSVNWAPWWMTFKNRLSLVPNSPSKASWSHGSPQCACVYGCSGECKGYTTAL